MKKTLATLLAVLMAIGLAACKPVPAPPDNDPSESPASAEREQPSYTAEEPSEDDGEDSSAARTTEKEEKSTQPVRADGVSPDFKEAMDAYEAFFDEYIAFMDKYEKAGSPVSMLTDYLAFLQKYADTMQKFEEIDTDTLPDADAAYYLEVQLRIVKKLADAAE